VQFCAPDDGRKTRLKHVQRLTEINKLWNIASCWLYFANILAMHGPMHVKLAFVYFSKICLENSSFIKFDKNNGQFTWTPIYILITSQYILITSQYILITSRSILLRMINVADEICREEQNIFYLQSLFRKLCRLWDNVERYCRAQQTTHHKMAHAHCMLDN